MCDTLRYQRGGWTRRKRRETRGGYDSQGGRNNLRGLLPGLALDQKLPGPNKARGRRESESDRVTEGSKWHVVRDEKRTATPQPEQEIQKGRKGKKKKKKKKKEKKEKKRPSTLPYQAREIYGDDSKPCRLALRR